MSQMDAPTNYVLNKFKIIHSNNNTIQHFILKVNLNYTLLHSFWSALFAHLLHQFYPYIYYDSDSFY